MPYIYYTLLVTSFIVSLLVYRYNKSLTIFSWVLADDVMSDIVAFIMALGFKVNHFIIYHINLPISYALTAYFFYNIINEPTLKKVIIYSVFFYAIVSAGLSIFFYSMKDFPGLQFNLYGFFLILMSAYVLLTLQPIHNIPMYKHPLAWICIGMIVFYTGIFFLNGIYNYLIKTKHEHVVLLHQIINNGLNCLMYIAFTIGLICSHKLKKYAAQGA